MPIYLNRPAWVTEPYLQCVRMAERALKEAFPDEDLWSEDALLAAEARDNDLLNEPPRFWTHQHPQFYLLAIRVNELRSSLAESGYVRRYVLRFHESCVESGLVRLHLALGFEPLSEQAISALNLAVRVLRWQIRAARWGLSCVPPDPCG